MAEAVTKTLDEQIAGLDPVALRQHLDKQALDAKIEKDDALRKTRQTYFSNFTKAVAGDKQSEQILKSLDTTSGFQVRESLSSTVETVVNDSTPLLTGLLGSSKGINNVTHQWNADFDSEDESALQSSYEFTIASLTEDGVNRVSYSYPVAAYAKIAKVGTYLNSEIPADGADIMDIETASVTRKTLREINRDLYDGDQTAVAKSIHGLNAFQRDNGNALLRLNAGGEKINASTLNVMIRKMREVGGGDVTNIYYSSSDDQTLQEAISSASPLTGRKEYRTPVFNSITGNVQPKLEIDDNPASVKKIQAVAYEETNGAVQITGAVANAETITIAGVVYTAAATESLADAEFASGAAADATASLIRVINAFTVNAGKVTATAFTTTAFNLTVNDAGALGNEYTVATDIANATINTATFSGGKNSNVYLVNLPSVQLCEFVLAGVKGFQSIELNSEEVTFEKRLVVWNGMLEYNNPYGIAVIENVG